MIVRRTGVQRDDVTEETDPQLGAFERLRYSDAGGLTQYGVYVETLQPGSRSSERHWHEKEDEFLYVIPLHGRRNLAAGAHRRDADPVREHVSSPSPERLSATP